MFKKLRLKIAFEFTVLVFLLLLCCGIIFIVIDYFHVDQKSQQRLQQTTVRILFNLQPFLRKNLPLHMLEEILPKKEQAQLRILDFKARPAFEGEIFTEAKIPLYTEPFFVAKSEKETYYVITLPLRRGSEVLGFLQLAERKQLQLQDILEKSLIFLFISALISAATFCFGLLFAEKSLKPAQAMFERLEQFTQDASHELRTPLAILSSSLDLALKTKNYHEGILSAKKDLAQATLLVERLLELTRLDKLALQFETINLTEFCHEFEKKYQFLAQKKNVSLESQIEKAVFIKGDVSLLRQLFINLLDNALKFTPSGGKISLKLQKNILTIQDTGQGMKAEIIPKIFDRFSQAEASRTNEGFGLGLALVKKIVELHQWKIKVASAAGEGSTFTVIF